MKPNRGAKFNICANPPKEWGARLEILLFVPQTKLLGQILFSFMAKGNRDVVDPRYGAGVGRRGFNQLCVSAPRQQRESYALSKGPIVVGWWVGD